VPGVGGAQCAGGRRSRSSVRVGTFSRRPVPAPGVATDAPPRFGSGGGGCLPEVSPCRILARTRGGRVGCWSPGVPPHCSARSGRPPRRLLPPSPTGCALRSHRSRVARVCSPPGTGRREGGSRPTPCGIGPERLGRRSVGRFSVPGVVWLPPLVQVPGLSPHLPSSVSSRFKARSQRALTVRHRATPTPSPAVSDAPPVRSPPDGLSPVRENTVAQPGAMSQLGHQLNSTTQPCRVAATLL
jgi:hypothetical protein